MSYSLNEQVVDMNTQRVGRVVALEDKDGNTVYRVDFGGIQESLKEEELAYFLTE